MISLENKNRLLYGIVFVCILYFGTLYSALSCSILFAIIGFICLYEMWQLRRGKSKELALLYVLSPFILIQICIWNYLNIESIWVPYSILNIFVLTWVFDSFAYLIGIKFGKRKIMPKISPKKSWEGFIGGLIFTLIAGFVVLILRGVNWMESIIILILIPISATAGDFIESYYKRQAGVKDSSNLIPGHGGMLDRMDSLLISFFILSILIIIFNPYKI
tara:strand:- start:670 stop:1326 length:657 start_codon:yes stop_codon:yes gene_type:complete